MMDTTQDRHHLVRMACHHQQAGRTQQWSSLFVTAWTTIQKGVLNGVLLVHLPPTSWAEGLRHDPDRRRFPVWAPPGTTAATDPGAIAFRAMFKQLGWSGITQQWFSYTQQAWV